ncbi:hypothetical protein ISCGN_007678 [Ixodes scapularis]
MGPDAARWDSLKVFWRSLCVREGKWRRRQLSHKLNKVLRRIRIIKRGGTFTPLMSEYLNLLRARYSRLLRESSGTAALQPWDSRPVSDPEALRYLRVSRGRGDRPGWVPFVATPGGFQSSHPPDIVSVFFEHFAALFRMDDYSPRNTSDVLVQQFCSSLPQVLPDLRNTLHRPVSAFEAYEALRGMKMGSAPGVDGLPAKFDKEFWPQVGTALVGVFNAFLRGGNVPDSFRRGRIVLVPKETGDPSTPQAWRPVTLLNADYKLLATILAHRLRDVLPELINPFQSCSVSGRSIFSSLTLTRDMFHFTKSRGFSGAFISLDQEKGCPLSPLLFVLCLDPLLRRIHDQPSVLGFPLPGSGSIKISEYADTVFPFVRDSGSVISALRLYEEYAVLSGARLNTSKSRAVLFGSFADPLPGGITVTSVVRVLGVLFDCHGVSAETWNSIATDVVHKAAVASRFSLPQSDRAYVGKSVLCARLWYASWVALSPPSVVRRITSVIFAFLWEGCPELVACPALRMSRSDGGLSIPCLPIGQ